MTNILFNIGIDRSGEFKKLPFILVATREGKIQERKIICFSQIDDKKYSKMIESRELKILAILTFLVVKPPLLKDGDEIHIDKDYPTSSSERDFLRYIRKLFFEFFPGQYPHGKPTIEFHTTKNSELVKWADKKCTWARKKYIPREKCPNLTKYLNCLE